MKTKLRRVLRRAQDEGIDLDASFQHFDKDGNGMISRSEMRQALEELGVDFKLDERELEVLFRDVCGGTDDEDEVSYAEFIRFAKGKEQPQAISNAGVNASDNDRTPDTFGNSRFRDKVKAMMARARKQGIDIKRAMDAYDTEQCGKIGHSDFRALLMTLGVSVADPDMGSLDVRDVKDQALVERQLSRIDDLRRARFYAKIGAWWTATILEPPQSAALI